MLYEGRAYINLDIKFILKKRLLVLLNLKLINFLRTQRSSSNVFNPSIKFKMVAYKILGLGTPLNYRHP